MDLLLKHPNSSVNLSLQSSDAATQDTSTEDHLAQNFHDAVVLLGILGPAEDVPKPLSTGKNHSSSIFRAFHKFMDQLAWLCDYKCGGKTVTSIAAEESADSTIFWIASNDELRHKGVAQLEWVLGELQSISSDTISQIKDTEMRIFAKSITLSAKKVSFYHRQLRRFISEVKSTVFNASSESDQKLLAQIEWLATQEDARELCYNAYQFRNSATFHELRDRISKKTETSDWSLVRHYIGRLGSWSRASKILVNMALTSPEMFINWRVMPVLSIRSTSNASGDFNPSVRNLLGRNFPLYDEARLEHALSSIMERQPSDRVEKILNAYDYRIFKPQIHAEIQMMEHFYLHGLKFAKNDPYIGCSKPSCYCCDLYMKLHPGNFTVRPCHGNVWIKWTAEFCGSEGLNVDDSHSASILNSMTGQIRSEIWSRIKAGRFGKKWVPDSTTGISTSTRSRN